MKARPLMRHPANDRHAVLTGRTDVVLFLGAGFTEGAAGPESSWQLVSDRVFRACSMEKHLPSGDSGLGEFLDRMYRRGWRKGSGPRLDDVLTLLDYSVVRQVPLHRDYGVEWAALARHRLIRMIAESINEGIRVEASPQCQSMFLALAEARTAGSRGVRTSVITTNYDVVVDKLLMAEGLGVNYGFNVRQVFTGEQLMDDDDARRSPEAYSRKWRLGNYSGTVNEGKVPLLKVHGSVNWLYCPKCNEVDAVLDDRPEGTCVLRSQAPVCASRACTAEQEYLLVTPTLFKVYENSFLARTWELAERALRNASVVIFIGYSLPEADYELRCLLTRALGARARLKIVVVDADLDQVKKAARRNAIRAVGRQYRSLFGNRVEFLPVGLSAFCERFGQDVTAAVGQTEGQS
jgi:NAD-dependent SIR2 family protein deacetylase